MKNASISAFIESLSAGKRPDLQHVSKWLASQKITGEEWDELSTAICEAYGFADDDALAAHFKRPEFSTTSDYIDDFSQVLIDTDIQGWIRDYIEHTRGMEAPTPFHFGTAITLLGAALRRQVYVDQGYYKLWPCVQTMLIGPSGRVKKSTAAGYGVELAGEVGQGGITMLPDEGSGEALKTELAQLTRKTGGGIGLLYISELGTFLGKQEYNVNLVQTLTDLFDSRVSKRRRTHAQGNLKINNIAVSFLGCSNEDWLADAIPASAFGGGFFGRLLVFYQPDTDRSFARPRVASVEDRENLIAGLASAKFVKGEAILTPAADVWFEKRYKKIKKEWPEDERLVPFYERIPDHLLRMSMLLSVSEDLSQRESISVTDRHLKQADGVVNWILRYLPRVYAHLGGTAFGDDHQRIYTIIRRKGGKIEDTELRRRMSRRLSRRNLDEHLDTMVRNGVVKREPLNPWEGKYGWRLLKKYEEGM